METHKALTILKILFAGYSVKLEDRIWYLTENNMLGIKMEHYTVDKNRNKHIKPGSENKIYAVEWSLSRFIEVCNALTDKEVKEICNIIKKEEIEILEVKSNKILFDKGKRLGDGIGLLLSGMVQNDNFIEKTKLELWGKELKQQVQQIIMQVNTIIEYIQNPSGEEYPTSICKEDNCSVLNTYDDLPF